MRVPPVELPELLEEPPDLEADTTRQCDPLDVALLHPHAHPVALLLTVHPETLRFDPPSSSEAMRNTLARVIGVERGDERTIRTHGE